MIRLRFLLFVLLFGISCCKQPGSREQVGDSRNVTATEESLPVNSEWNDRALLLAGMPVSSSYAERPEIKALLAKPFYVAHKQKMDGFWKSVEARRLNVIRPWREKYLGDRIRSRTALYPLSGGDFLNLNLMYPYAERYIMIAMEKPGEIPDPTKMSDPQFQNGLLSVQQMAGNIAQTGYFFSRLMNMYMNPETYAFFGTMPTVSIFIVRLGHTILDVQKACVTDAGTLEFFAEKASGVCRIPGYRIQFRDARGKSSRELIYLSTRIDNSLFAADRPEGKFFRGIGRASVMLKAAVYLLHSPDYKAAADYVLDTADVILQDDSGLPYRYFTPEEWNVELYGTFIAPPRMTGVHYYPQPDLVKAYKEKSLELPFDFGYGQVEPTGKSGILVAFRKSGDRSSR